MICALLNVRAALSMLMKSYREDAVYVESDRSIHVEFNARQPWAR
jgi:hypothetical protein